MPINMNIKIITGRRGMNIKRILQEYDRDFEGYENILKFPETEICHSYDLCDCILKFIQKNYEENKNIVIITYSEVVLDATRLWVARNSFEGARCIMLINNSKLIESKINTVGEMDNWERGTFDIKQKILYELFKIRRNRESIKKENI